MLNPPDPRGVWEDTAKDNASVFPSPKVADNVTTASLASRFGFRVSSKQRKGNEDGPSRPKGERNEEVKVAEIPMQSLRDLSTDDDEAELPRTPQSAMLEGEKDVEPESPLPSITEPIRPSALAARRHLQQAPHNVSFKSATLPPYLQTPIDSRLSAPMSPQPLPSSAGVGRTPKTADMRTKLEARIYEPEVMEMIEAYADERVKCDRKEFGGHQSKSPKQAASVAYGIQALERNSVLAELRTKMLLAPAMLLLSRPQSLKADDIETAIRYARSAQGVGSIEMVDEPLQARCCYYIGLAAFMLLPKHALHVLGRPTSIGSQSELGKLETVQMYFEQACAAKSVYNEGIWAEEWVEYLKSPEVRRELSHSMEGERPTSSGSWVRGWLTKVWGPKTTQPTDRSAGIPMQSPNERLRRRKDSALSYDTNTTSRPDAPERIPSFESWHSSNNISLVSTPTQRPTEAIKPAQNSGRNQAPDGLLTFNDPSNGSTEPILPAPVTSPNTSPNKRTSFAALSQNSTSPSSDTSTSSPLYERRHSRKPSLIATTFAKVTGRERRPSELERAEEGHSPYRPTFEDLPEGAEMVRRVAESSAPEDIV